MSTPLEWMPYTGADSVPRNEPLLMEIESTAWPWQIGFFRRSGNGKAFGVVGGHFHYDQKIIRWARIAHLLPAPAPEPST